MMSPSMSLTVRYISLTSSNLWPRPSASTWGCRFVYWPPGISVFIYVRHRERRPFVEVGVALAHVAPVVGELLQPLGVEPGVALRAAQQRLDERVHGGLAGQARERAYGAVHYVHARLRRQEVGGDLVVRGVVGVQVDGMPISCFSVSTSFFAP